MDDLVALSTATEEFRSRLRAVADSQWDAPTPCGDWDVTALVTHVNVGNRMAELLLHGADAKTSVGPLAQPPIDVTAATTYDITGADQATAFAEDGALGRVVHHIAMDMPGDVLLMFRVLDLAMHAWDLAVAIDADPAIDLDVADWVWVKLEPLVPLLAGSGLFGEAKRELPADPTSFDKLLHGTGR